MCVCYRESKPLSTIKVHAQPGGVEIATTKQGTRVLRCVSHHHIVRHRSNKDPTRGFTEGPGPSAKGLLEDWLELDRIDAR